MAVPNILIIDDSATIRMFMVRALQKAGYHISLAASGTEGLQKALLERPHCVILDIILPGINGYQLCRQLRAMDPEHDLAIVMISSKNSPVDQSWGLRQGADRYLAKPFTEEELLGTVQDVLRRTTHS
jgi:twitching motility two-component system response regulator PilH